MNKIKMTARSRPKPIMHIMDRIRQKIFFISFLSSAIINTAFSSSTGALMLDTNKVNYVDVAGKKQGLWVTYIERLRVEIYYRDNLLNGVYKSYFQNGQLDCIGEYLNDIPSGVWFSFSEQGFLLLRVSNIRINDLRIKNEAKREIAPKLKCFFSYYYLNGFVKEQGDCYSDGAYDTEIIKDGLWKCYSEQGKLIKEELYKEGNLITTKQY